MTGSPHISFAGRFLLFAKRAWIDATHLTAWLCSLVLLQYVVAATGQQPAVNPESLFEPVPEQRDGVDTNATLVMRIKAGPTSLNPILMYTGIDSRFDYLLWDRPFIFDENLEWATNPSIVQSYHESADHKHADLELKRGLKWHDGQPYTASDVVFSWERIVDQRTICRKAQHGPDQLESCTALDPLRVRFTFKQPLPTNKWNINFPILPKHIYEKGMEDDPTLERSDYHVGCNRNPVGNGPYRFVEWDSAQQIVLERWEDYPGSEPAFRRIVLKIIPDNNAALLAFEAGHIHEMELTPQQFALETEGERFANVGVKGKSSQWTNYYIGWNTDSANPYFNDIRVRRAMCYALDLPRIRKQVFFDLYPRSNGLYHPDSWAYPTGITPYRFDPKEAARLLDEAGWRIDDDDGWRYRSIDGNDGQKTRIRFAFTLNLIQGSQTSPKVADVFQDTLRKLGIEMTTRTLEWSVFNERNFKHDFEAFLSAWTPGPEPDDAWNLFHSESLKNGRNYVGYSNKVVDGLFEEARSSFDFDTRKNCYQRIGKIIYEEAPYTFIVNAPTLWAFDKRMRGVRFSPRGPHIFYPGPLSWWIPK